MKKFWKNITDKVKMKALMWLIAIVVVSIASLIYPDKAEIIARALMLLCTGV